MHWNWNFKNVALKISTLDTDLHKLLHSARPTAALLDMTQSALCIPLHFKGVRQEPPNRLRAAKEILLFPPAFVLQ